MPFGLVILLASAVVGARVFSRQIQRNELPRTFFILAIVFLIAMFARELDASFWKAVAR